MKQNSPQRGYAAIEKQAFEFSIWFFWDESGKELKEDQGIEQAILRKGVADAGLRTVPTVNRVRGTVGSDRSQNRL